MSPKIKVSKPGSPGLTIGRVAKLAGVGIQAIRFYERKGILKKPHRRESGYREFSYDAVRQLRFIKRAQQLGFSLKEITQLLAIRADPKQNCAATRRKAEAKRNEIEQKILDLERIKKVLRRITKECDAAKPASDCSILQCFDDDLP